MKNRSWCCVPLFLICAFLPAHALQASPQDALEEIATADKIDTVIKHLPVKVEEYLQKLPAKEKAELAEKLLLSKNLERDGGKLTRSDSGNAWELVEREGKEHVTITFKNTYISGAEALVELEINTPHRPETIFVGMRLEAGEWRVQKAGQWQKADLEEEFLRKEGVRTRAEDSGTAAVSTLRTLNTAIVTYQTAYDDQGCPPSLQALSGKENEEATREHAMLVDPTYLQDPVIKNGYEFRYLRLDHDHYQITATPVEFGSGAKSLFTDETAVIRFTAESRPANASDPAIQ